MTALKLKILAGVKDDLLEIEKALEENLNPYLELVSDTARHILFAGGKRLRPLLMVLCARLCGYRGNEDKRISTIFEYLHAATLLHDDLVDDASIRRGKTVAHKVFGNPTAVLVGDFLLARGLSIAADTGKTEVIRVIAEITENMSQGEIHQLMRKSFLEMSQEEYMEVIRRKTAVLIRGACLVGAMISEAPASVQNALADYGHNLGIAFQMADDLLDYTADSKVLGKEIGADLREGKLTLPVIYALGRTSGEDRTAMGKIIQNPEFTEKDFGTLLQFLQDTGALEYTRQKAAEHIRVAKKALSGFEPSKTLMTMMDIADYALARKL